MTVSAVRHVHCYEDVIESRDEKIILKMYSCTVYPLTTCFILWVGLRQQVSIFKAVMEDQESQEGIPF